ncbi:MAG: MopE-related protein [Myxococcota bacterium]
MPFVLLLACAGDDAAIAEGAATVDEDGDGWPLGLDCDDEDEAVHPGVPETCDGLDEDCDGVTDDHPADGVAVWRDADLDGWGDAGAPDLVCEPTAGWAASAGDCDDGDPLAYPFATESCATEADDDCDNSTNDADATGCEPFYEDTDGDGYGTARARCLCAPDGNYRTQVPGDCDDGDAAVVDGCALGGEVPLEDADVRFVGAEPADLAGADVHVAGDLDGDGLADLLVGAPGHREGAAYVLRGPFDGDRDLSAPEGRALLPDTRETWSVTARGGHDLDGDGEPDVLVVGAYEDVNRTARVSAWVVDGTLAGDLDLAERTPALTTAVSDDAPNVADVGDATGDGVGDALFGEPGADRAWLVPGPLPSDAAFADAGHRLYDSGACLGTAVAFAGDLDGDGLGDLALGGPCDNGQAADAGLVWVLAGPVLDDVTSPGDAAARVEGPAIGYALLGSAVAGAGDVDGDGYGDLLAVAAGEGVPRGVAWLLAGPLAGDLAVDADARAAIEGDDDASLSTCAGAGDVDGDGLADVLLGGPGDDGGAPDGGIVAFVRGDGLAGTLALSEADALLTSAGPGASAGAALAGGDVDGDGFADVLVGAPGLDVGDAQAGGAFLLFGGR